MHGSLPFWNAEPHERHQFGAAEAPSCVAANERNDWMTVRAPSPTRSSRSPAVGYLLWDPAQRRCDGRRWRSCTPVAGADRHIGELMDPAAFVIFVIVFFTIVYLAWPKQRNGG
jgi:hypothetical protein